MQSADSMPVVMMNPKLKGNIFQPLFLSGAEMSDLSLIVPQDFRSFQNYLLKT
jgi:hypothetical protein